MDDFAVEAWADDLFDVSYEDALEAMREHFRSSTEWFTAAHAIRHVKAKKAAGVTMSPTTPDRCQGEHLWTVDGSCAMCMARNPKVAQDQWWPPSIGTGVPSRKPENFDEMVEAARVATEKMVARGASRGDNAVKDAAWYSADAVARGIE